jgi:hypothetical protein
MRHTDPFEEVLEKILDFWSSEEDVFGRVCAAALDTTEYTHHTEISERADCSSNTTKKHLTRLVQFRIIEKAPRTPRYRRNESYLEWRVLAHIVEEYSIDEIIERVEALESRQETLVGSTGEVPSVVSASDVKSHEKVGPQMGAANELERIKRRIRLYELARQVSQSDGHLVSGPL